MPVKDTVAIYDEIDENRPNQQVQVPDLNIAQPVMTTTYLKTEEDQGRSKARHVSDEDIFGDKSLKMTGKMHFALNEEDHVAQIMDHPLSHYTTTNTDDDE